MRLPVISLWMPWAFWIPLGWKRIETRLHRRFASLVGKRIAIHASVKWDESALEAAKPYLSGEQYRATMKMLRIGGAIIATAFVAEFRKLTAEDSAAALIDCGGTERYGLILTDVHTLSEAIPSKGKQGIWYAEIEEQK